MAYESKSPNLSILHVLTLNGRNGEYGGPVRVARELCTELNARGFETHIFSGAIRGSDPQAKDGLSESFVHVKPLSEKFRVSSLWSWKLLKPLNQLIRKSDLVHIHFARDLIPFLAGMLAIVNRKPFVAQTHGMIISDDRLSTRLVDSIFTRPLINKSRKILVLTEMELTEARSLNLKPDLEILPNGIEVDLNSSQAQKSGMKVIFCSRLEKRKGVDKFIELAWRFRKTSLKFEIYGPDSGELDFVQNEIKQRKLENNLEYKGTLQSWEVQDELRKAHLLVLPSRNEPFPMIVLEALSVGTLVLIMPSCGISQSLSNFEPNFVAQTEDVNGLEVILEKHLASSFTSPSNSQIKAFCEEEFGIGTVVSSLSKIYLKEISNA
jgi:glycosyltransferase involved in cell wall biosynthesis